jgi:hypothetical protein
VTRARLEAGERFLAAMIGPMEAVDLDIDAANRAMSRMR